MEIEVSKSTLYRTMDELEIGYASLKPQLILTNEIKLLRMIFCKKMENNDL